MVFGGRTATRLDESSANVVRGTIRWVKFENAIGLELTHFPIARGT